MRFFCRDGRFIWSIKGLSLWRAGGGPGVPYVYGFGFWCGKDDDLLCVSNFGVMETRELEQFLSPLKCSRLHALLQFLSRRRT